MGDSLPCGWRVIGSSVIGSSHIRQNLPCQDAHGIAQLDNGVVVVAVADGAGSAKCAQDASRSAVESSRTFLIDRLRTAPPLSETGCKQLLEDAVIEARRSLDARSRNNALALSDFATTLLLTFVTDQWLSTIQIGDGAVVCRDLDGSLRVLSKRSDGEYVNETTFLTSSDFMAKANSAVINSAEIDAFAAISDGLQFLALNYQDNTAHAPFFSPLFQFVTSTRADVVELQEFLLSKRVCERTDDDKTVVLAVRDRAVS